MELILNGVEILATGNGTFIFSTLLDDNVAYNVGISSQPNGYTCIVVNGSGLVANNDVSSISVSCQFIVTPG